MRAVWQENIARLVGEEHGRRKQIANAAGMSPSQFGDLINKSGRNPQLKQLERIAGALGVSVATLFDSSILTTGNPDRATAGVALDPSALATAIRGAIRDVLTDMLEAVAHADARADDARHRQVSDTGTHPASRSDDSADDLGTLHRHRAG